MVVIDRNKLKQQRSRGSILAYLIGVIPIPLSKMIDMN